MFLQGQRLEAIRNESPLDLDKIYLSQGFGNYFEIPKTRKINVKIVRA